MASVKPLPTEATVQTASPVDQLQVDTVKLEEVETSHEAIAVRYDVDGDPNTLRLEYDTIDLERAARTSHPHALATYAACLGALGVSRFGAVLPRRVDLTEHSRWLDPRVVTFLKRALPRKWSEHRYQLGRLDYYHPEIVVDEASLGASAATPVWRIPGGRSRRVLLATGSGKDSLLCELMLERAGVDYESFTYLHDLYGDIDDQREIFARVPRELAANRQHVVQVRDDLQPWLERRMASVGVPNPIQRDGIAKPFRTEAGEVLVGSLAMVPIQVTRGIGVQAFGNERSADHPNLVDPDTGEAIAHQFAKSIYGETLFQRLYERLFANVARVSLTKPINDTRIFRTLFELGGDRAYLTNSCNLAKPWCRRCEKCLYVFAGFSAFGDHAATVAAFGGDPFDDPATLPVWEDLLGLNGRIAWECVGHPEELALYLYKAVAAGIDGCAIDMFRARVLEPLCASNGTSLDDRFAAVERSYSEVDPSHHRMPAWLSSRVLDVLGAGPAGRLAHD